MDHFERPTESCHSPALNTPVIPTQTEENPNSSSWHPSPVWYGLQPPPMLNLVPLALLPLQQTTIPLCPGPLHRLYPPCPLSWEHCHSWLWLCLSLPSELTVFWEGPSLTTLPMRASSHSWSLVKEAFLKVKLWFSPKYKKNTSQRFHLTQQFVKK